MPPRLQLCRGMDDLREFEMHTLAQISHAMASQAQPSAKLRRIAALAAIHTDMAYSCVDPPATRKPSVVIAIGAAPAGEDFDDDAWEREEGAPTWPEDTSETESGPNATSSSSASAPLITSTSAAALDATESTSGSSASTGIRKHRGEPLLELPLVKKARPPRNPTTPHKTPVPPNYPPPHLRLGLNTYTF